MPALLLAMPGPRSFTGEHCIELLLPGHPALAEAACAALCAVPGVRRAHAGEFMARAHAAGRMPLEEAERIALAIAAQDAQELDAARAVRSSPLVGASHEASAAIAGALARVEAGIDFTDAEDVVAIDAHDLARSLSATADALEAWVARSMPAEAGRAHPVVALRGAPNAGKSTLFNALLGRARAVTSPVAGTTRDAIAEPLTVTDAHGTQRQCTLVDLPGIEDPRSALDALMQAQRSGTLDRADLVLRCVPLASIGEAVASGAHLVPGGTACTEPLAKVPLTLHVATRADEVPAAHRAEPVEPPCRSRGNRGSGQLAADALVTSAVNGEGIDQLRLAIADALAHGLDTPRSAGQVMALARHREAMSRAAALLRAACQEARAGQGCSAAGNEHPVAVRDPEVVAHSMRAALDALGEVTGAVTPDDVLGLVFSRFCIGK